MTSPKKGRPARKRQKLNTQVKDYNTQKLEIIQHLLSLEVKRMKILENAPPPNSLQLLLDEKFGGSCVLPKIKSSHFHKYQVTVLAFEISTHISR